MWRAFSRSFGYTLVIGAALLFALCLVSYFTDDDGSRPGFVVYALFAAAYSLYLAAFPAIAFAFLVLAWRIARAWILVPIVTVPALVWLSLWLFQDVLAGCAAAVGGGLGLATARHTWLIAGLGKAAHAGPVVLIIALPLLVIDLGMILISPEFLVPLLVLMAVFVAVVLAGLIPATMISIPALAIGYWRGFKRRHPQLFPSS